MPKRKRTVAPYPRELLGDIGWSFLDPPFASQTAFIDAVRQYEREVQVDGEGESTWRPDEVVLHAHRVRITCEYWDDPEELINRVMFDDETGDLQTDLTADGPEGFTAGELLFKVHNAFTRYLSEGDHHFFEGLARVKGANPNAVPVYEVHTGS
jgi:hypothetical protein